MTRTLDPLRHALAAMTDDSLSAVRDASIRVCHLAPSFTAWIKHAVDWETDRRAGAHYFLLFPEELVSLHEFARGARCALDAVAAEVSGSGRLADSQALLHALRVLAIRCEGYRPA